MSEAATEKTSPQTKTAASRGPVAIIGAGPAGLYLGRSLANAGIGVQLFEKSGDVSGRLATRGRDGHRWNHGAAAADVSSAALAALPLPQLQSIAAGHSQTRWQAEPCIADLLRPLARGLPIRFRQQVTALARGQDDLWSLSCAGPRGSGQVSGFSAVLCALPAPQLQALMQASELTLPAAVADASYEPQWTLLLALQAPASRSALPLPTELAILRTGLPEPQDASSHWIAQATGAWSTAQLELSPDQAASKLTQLALPLLAGSASQAPQLAIAKAHRWRYSRVATAAAAGPRWISKLRFGFAGDWCLGPTVGDALLSAQQLAQNLITEFQTERTAQGIPA
jgi:predicted NAD/FAD-dependent oxidoreductase